MNLMQIYIVKNSRYNLGSNAYEKAETVSKKYDAEPFWMAIQFDTNEYSVYFGLLESLDGAKAIPVNKCEKGEVGSILVNKKRHFLTLTFIKTNRR